mgnify:CR=1 FL=1
MSDLRSERAFVVDWIIVITDNKKVAIIKKTLANLNIFDALIILLCIPSSGSLAHHTFISVSALYTDSIFS